SASARPRSIVASIRSLSSIDTAAIVDVGLASISKHGTRPGSNRRDSRSRSWPDRGRTVVAVVDRGERDERRAGVEQRIARARSAIGSSVEELVAPRRGGGDGGTPG